MHLPFRSCPKLQIVTTQCPSLLLLFSSGLLYSLNIILQLYLFLFLSYSIDFEFLMYCGNSPLFAAEISCSNLVLNVHHYSNVVLATDYFIQNQSSSPIDESDLKLNLTFALVHSILQIISQIQLLQGYNVV